MLARLRGRTKPTKTAAKRQPEYLVRDKLALLLVMQALLILPLLINLPVWLWLVWALVAMWRIQMFRGRWGTPGGLIKTLLVFVCAAGMLASYSGRAGTDTMVGLLVCTFSLKLLEVNSPRDAQLLIFIGLVVTATQFLFSQTPLAAAYGLLCVVFLLTAWRSLYLTHEQVTSVRLKRGAMILLHAVPMMLVLFVVIPRLGPLWAVPNQQMAKTGFSDSLSPGDLGNLALDNSPAFRVEFADTPPVANQLYWRGLVLDAFDGRTWRMRDSWGFRPVPAETATSTKRNSIDYSIIVEPHGQPWLFSLMTPQRVDNITNSIRITADSLLMNRIPVGQRMRYEVNSALQVEWPTPPQLTSNEQEFYTRLPDNSNPQTRALVESWRNESMTDKQVIDRALGLFNREFTYTLQPPVLGQHSVDEFLLISKQGFCEHFASSFSFLLRAAGIPARVVVGYQGGSWNPVENYLLVRQSDAHAWTEVWVDGIGWKMIDPTAAVAPNRIEQGMNEALNANDQQLVADAWRSSRLLYTLQLRWDAANYSWQRWVLNYDSEAQEGLLSRLLGGSEPWRITLWLIGLGLVGVALFVWALMRSHKKPVLRPEDLAIKKLEGKLEQFGYRRKTGETLCDFIHRVIHKEPQLQKSLTIIVRLFEAIAYQDQTERLPQLQQTIKQFPR